MIYDFKIDDVEENSPFWYICENIGRNQRVLDVGCATGYLGELLKNNFEVDIVGIDYQDYHLNKAQKRNVYSDLINLDLNSFENELNKYNNYFDRIILADVLEHLTDPMEVLVKLSKLLKSDGKFLIDIPNIAHASIKYNLLSDNFDYTPMGLLDNTHIRFFTLNSIIKELSRNKFLIEKIEYIFFGPGQFHDQSVNYANYPKEIIDYVENDIESAIYQIFLVFEKSDLDHESLLNRNIKFKESDIITEKEKHAPETINNPLKTLEDIIQENNNAITYLERNLNQKNDDIVNLLVKLQEKDNNAISLLTKLQEKSDNIVYLERKLNEKINHFNNLNKSYKGKNESIIRLTKNIKKKDGIINKMEGSNSWKITKPLRNLTFTLKKLKNRTSSFKNQRKVLKKTQAINLSVDLVGDLTKILYLDNPNSSSYYIKKSDRYFEREEEDIKIIAFYLPQFHTIKENDEWWGKGFTEWDNVTRAIPQIKGQYQPQLPDELGFYDLSHNDIFDKQIELAKKYGLYGFCFHYYWFSGKKLLEKPILNYLKDKTLDFPFMLSWANEPWTRAWNGSDQDVLMPQTFEEEDFIKFIEDIMPFFIDERYILINNCPILQIYRPQYFSKKIMNAAIEVWRDYVKENGFDDLYLINAESHDYDSENKYENFDASVQFLSHKMQKNWRKDNNAVILNPEFTGRVFDLEAFVKEKTYLQDHDYTLYRTVVPGWDNTARVMSNATILNNSSPELYKEWLENIVKYTKNKFSKDNQFVFVHSWNEWAEGAHLEPDKKYGFAYLEATLDVLNNEKN